MTRAVITIGPDRRGPGRRGADAGPRDRRAARDGRWPVVGIVTEADILRGFARLTGGPAGGPARGQGP